MEQDSLQPEPIEPPNIHNKRAFETWLRRYVDRPFGGYDDLRHPDGTPFSYQEQVATSIAQLRKTAEEWFQIGRTPEQISNALVDSVQMLRRDNPPPQTNPSAHK